MARRGSWKRRGAKKRRSNPYAGMLENPRHIPFGFDPQYAVGGETTTGWQTTFGDETQEIKPRNKRQKEWNAAIERAFDTAEFCPEDPKEPWTVAWLGPWYSGRLGKKVAEYMNLALLHRGIILEAKYGGAFRFGWEDGFGMYVVGPSCTQIGSEEETDALAELLTAWMLQIQTVGREPDTKGKPIANMKQAMNTLLTVVGLRGERWKETRKILLRGLFGDSAGRRKTDDRRAPPRPEDYFASQYEEAPPLEQPPQVGPSFFPGYGGSDDDYDY